jgi:hypothetical protein
LTDENLAKTKSNQETEVFRILNLATELDPAYYPLYIGGANYLAVARDDRFGALKLVEKGERYLLGPLKTQSEEFRKTHWADSWRLYLTKGYLYLLEFQDAKRASEAYSHMGDFEDAPEAIKLMAKSNKSPEAQFNLAANSIRILRAWRADDAKYQAELDVKVKFLLTAKDLVIWNRKFRETLGRRSATSEAFRQFRTKYKIPDRDHLGGEIYLNSSGKIDTKTEKVPTLGTDLDSVLRQGS